jgi:type II secretory pathway pseudopilin PulG
MLDVRTHDGYTVIELLFGIGVMTTMAAMAVPSVLAGLDDYRALGAVRYMATRLQRTRMEAVSHQANAALRFVTVDGSYRYGVFLDGNGDGVRAADIADGTDTPIQAEEALSHQFKDVDFGALPGLPPVDPSSPPPGSDPIRFGAADSVSFTPLGTATPGSLYILGPRSAQYCVRVMGETGRTRILKFNVRRWQWDPL